MESYYNPDLTDTYLIKNGNEFQQVTGFELTFHK